MPSNRERRAGTVERRRAEYVEAVRTYWDVPEPSRSAEELALYRQVCVSLAAQPCVSVCRRGIARVSHGFELSVTSRTEAPAAQPAVRTKNKIRPSAA